MVVLTRTQKDLEAAADLKHVINVIMNQPDGSPITQALESLGVVDTFDMLSLCPQQIKSMSYRENKTTMAVNAATRNIVTIFIAYIAFYGISPIGKEFGSITKDDFDTYRITQYLNPTAPSTSGLQATTTYPKTRDLVADFKRGI